MSVPNTETQELLDRAREARARDTKEWLRIANQLFCRAYGEAIRAGNEELAATILAERDSQ